MREAGPNPALSRNCEWGAFGRRPLRRSPWEGGRHAVIHKPGDPFLERSSHLRGSVGMPPAARFPCQVGWLRPEDRFDAARSARGQRETGRPDRNVRLRRLLRADVVRRCAIGDTQRSDRALSGDHRAAGRQNGEHHEAAAPHRVSFLHRDRDALRHRRGITGDRGRRPVELSVDLGHFHRAVVQAARADQHRRRRDLRHARLSAAVGRVHRGVESRPDRAGGHEVLPAGPAHRRGAPWLGRDRRGQDGPGDRGRRRHRVALGTANHRLHASRRDSCPAGREGGVTVGVKLASARRLAGGSPTLLRGLPRLPWIWAAAGCVALLLCCAIGVLAGPVHIGLGTVARALLAPLPWFGTASSIDPGQANILWSLRFPRVVLGVLVGGTLAVAGAAYQGVFRNPLADPYLLGAAAGAHLGATLAIAFAPGTSVSGINIVPLAAFVGAGAAVAGAYALGRSVTGLRSATGLILAGVAIATFFNSIQSYVQQTQTSSIRMVYSWILGRLVTAGWDDVLLVLPYVALSVAVIFLHRRLLDALTLGEDEITSLGISTRRIRLIVVVAATLGTAAVVAVGGTIAFVGIIIPHTVRLLAGRSYRAVVPLSLLFGAGFLVLADTASRTLVAPAELPIGVITAFVGAPFFIVVLRSTRMGPL